MSQSPSLNSQRCGNRVFLFTPKWAHLAQKYFTGAAVLDLVLGNIEKKLRFFNTRSTQEVEAGGSDV